MQAICRLQKNVQEPGSSDADTLRGQSREIMTAVRECGMPLTCCFVKMLPFATDGELMPVLLPCGCTMSRAAARVAVKSGACQLCNDDVSSDAVYDMHRAVLRVVQAERWGISVPEMPRSRLTLGSLLGQGAQGSVHEAVLMAEAGDSKRNVAVKVVPIPDGEGMCQVPEHRMLAAWSRWWPLPTLPATARTFARFWECPGHRITSGAMLCL